MGYACPVCSDPQADANHLANHLAFTALVRGGDHEAWLDEHVTEWEQRGEDDLAAVVVDYAETEEFPQVFEDTVGGTTGEHEHDHDHDHDDERSGRLFEDDAPPGGRQRSPGRQPAASVSDADAAAVLEEARKLTEQRLTDESEGSDGDGDGSGSDSDSDADPGDS